MRLSPQRDRRRQNSAGTERQRNAQYSGLDHRLETTTAKMPGHGRRRNKYMQKPCYEKAQQDIRRHFIYNSHQRYQKMVEIHDCVLGSKLVHKNTHPQPAVCYTILRTACNIPLHLAETPPRMSRSNILRRCKPGHSLELPRKMRH